MGLIMSNHKQSLKSLVRELSSLTIYRGVLSRPVTSVLLNILDACLKGNEDIVCDAWGRLCYLLTAEGRNRSLPSAVFDEVLQDENSFVISLIKDGADISDSITKLARRDLDILYRAATCSAYLILENSDETLSDYLPRWSNEPAPLTLDMNWSECIDRLEEYHRKNGIGLFSVNKAFLWQNGAIRPVKNPDHIRLSHLKSYEVQRKITVDNTLAFLDGFEANNILLYGDRGTGKSSTVKSLLNEYAHRGLRMIEMPKESLNCLPDLTAQLASFPMKFIIFIDDLSFSGSDDNFAALKAVLEGGLEARPKNVLVYATSNRRHLLRETFSDRNGDEIHRADTLQESVSLSDRFGILLTFLLPDKKQFFLIVEQMAADNGLNMDSSTLLDAAERWALERGGRSPRFAKQFIADAKARLSRGEKL